MPSPLPSARRALLYCRVSKGAEQDPESQAHALRQFCEQRGWVVVGVEVDRVTGDPARRRQEPPGLAAAMRQLADRRADVLVVFSADRLTRGGILSLVQLVRRIRQLGAHVASYREGHELDTTSDTGELVAAVLGWLARMELNMIRERSRAGQERARAEGKRIGRPPEALPDLERVRELQRAGRGYRSISRELQCSEWAARLALEKLKAGCA